MPAMRAPLRSALRVAITSALLVAAAWQPAARAGLPALAGELRALEAELAELRRIVPAQAADPEQRGRFEVRLGQLEEELRRLTGRIEQLEFGQRNLEGRFDRLIGDLDQRLRSLEQGTPVGEVREEVSPTPPASAPPVAGVPAIAPIPGRASGGAVPPPAPAQTLGQIPQSAVLALPRPDPATIPPPETRQLTAQQQYDAAMELLRAGDYGGAERGLQLFLELNPDHELAANAAYWLAETFYVRKNYAAAAAAFARNYQNYGKSAPKAPDNLLKLGMALEGLGEKDQACLSYGELDKEFPNAPVHIQQALARERERADCV
jgi:tol-pal system protein YbgF